MPPELLTLLTDLGGTAVMVWLIVGMREEAKADRKQMWDLITHLIKRDDPDFDSQIAKLPSDKRP